MRPHVTSIVVSRGSAEALSGALTALAAGTRVPDDVIVLHPAGLRPALPSVPMAVQLQHLSDGGLHAALRQIITDGGDPAAHWLGLLRDDDVVDAGALAALLATVETSPSVAVAGPKLLGEGTPPLLLQQGITQTPSGVLVPAVPIEPDQGQYDTASDVLAVGGHGMLVRADAWLELDGSDPALSAPDAALDFGMRARRAGHRIVVVPEAKVFSADPWGPLEKDRKYGIRAARTGQVRRRLATAPAWLLPFQWLLLPVLAVIRALGNLLAKRPSGIPAELTALTVMFDLPGIAASRKRQQRARRLPVSALAPLMRSRKDLSRARSLERERERVARTGQTEPLGFWARGGLLTTIAAALLGLAGLGPLIGAAFISGGAVVPLGDLGQLWTAAGFAATASPVADPAHTVLAVLGTLTPWAPSLAIVLLWLLAAPLAAAGAWLLASGLTTKPLVRAMAGIAWAVAPMFWAALSEGRFGAVLAHIGLPWLVLAVFRAARSWTASAAASLLFLVVAASAPSLLPALLAALVVLTVIRIRAAPRFLLIPVPAALLALPLIFQQLALGQPLALLADPGVPYGYAPAPAWQLALGMPEAGLGGWIAWLGGVAGGHPVLVAAIVVALLLLPMAAPALFALFRTGMGRATVALVIALLGYLTAVAAQQIAVVHEGLQPIRIWPGAGLSLYWLGILGAAVLGLAHAKDLFRPLTAMLGLVALVLPLVQSLATGTAVLAPNQAQVPAIVEAQARTTPSVGTIVLTPQADGGVTVDLLRGDGLRLQNVRTAQSSLGIQPGQEALAQVAVDLISGNASAAEADVADLGVGFVLLRPAASEPRGTLLPANEPSDSALLLRERAGNALDAQAAWRQVSDTELGTVWQWNGTLSEVASETAPARAGHEVWRIAQWIVLALTVLVALPFRMRREVGHG